MPNYEYQCTKDGSRFELWQEVGSPAPACPTCGAETKKVFHVPRVIFKGSGFYLTDTRAEKSGGTGKSEESAPAAAPAKIESAPASGAPTPAPSSTPSP